MAGAAASLAALKTVQALLTLFQSTLGFGGYMCPVSPTVDTVESIAFDFIIVGGGTAGSVLANRLSECSDNTVLVIEAGGCPPLESVCLGYFTLTPLMPYDYNMTSSDDGYSCQNLQGHSVGTTAGKGLGGSSILQHMISVRGSSKYYDDDWATAANDSSWGYDGLLPYFIKSENVVDEDIAADTTYHGTTGPTILSKQSDETNAGIISAFIQLGYSYVNDINGDTPNGVTEPQLQLGNNLRQSSTESYIRPVKCRSNLYVLTSATATKINFDSNNVATGVTFTYGESSYTATANNEVIVAAGALKTPQLLMLSGVGPSEHLTDKGISVVSDLAGVGQNLMDHPGVMGVIALDNDNSSTPAANPFEFPVPMTISFANLDNRRANYSKFSSINLYFPHDSDGLMQLCMNVFKYLEDICEKIYNANVGRNVLVLIPNHLQPVSRGYVLLNTTDITDQPIVWLNLLNNTADLVDLASYVAHTANIVNTTYIQSVGGEFIDLGLCSDYDFGSTDYWQCYTLAMSSTMWHYSGTCAIGSVVDASLNVYGVTNLRVVDASVFPGIPAGNINAAVLATAEKAADIIKSDYGLSCSIDADNVC